MRNDCEIACDCVKLANMVLHVGLCKEIFAREHIATHKPTSAHSAHMTTMTHTHTHTHTPINRLWSPLAYGLGGNKYHIGLFFWLEACPRNAAGRSTAVWPANAKLPLPHRNSSITRPCLSIERSERQAPCIVFTCTSSTRHAQTASTRMGVYATSR